MGRNGVAIGCADATSGAASGGQERARADADERGEGWRALPEDDAGVPEAGLPGAGV